ncbi:MAG: CHC2 zinc finger domain-containing protein, partial [Lutispora sp.]
MFFSEELISEIIEKNDIVDIISQYMNLKKRGKNHIGLCPFHSEKTPSFSVSQDKQLFYCFGCSEGGNVSTFIQKIEKMTYPESLRFLAEKAGIEIGDDVSKEDLEKAKKKQNLLRINKEAARFFYKNLHVNTEAMQYLYSRGLSLETIKKFGLGFSQNSWDSFKRLVISRGLGEESASFAGLLVKKNNN